jgi:mannose-1-phosphate guanylyltransferase/phosphomannomutase
MVLNYAYSPASLVVPAMIGELSVELIALNAFVDAAAANRTVGREMELVQTARLVRAVGADLGVLFDVAAERVWLVDETGEPLDAATTLLLLVRELSAAHEQGTLLVPITETRLVEEVASGGAERVERTKASLHSLLSAATDPGVIFAGASGGGYVFPDFLAAYDAVMSTARVLEMLAHSDRRLSDLAHGLPRSTLVHRIIPCPWEAKGTTMRRLIEAAKGIPSDSLDGLKVFEDDGWVQMLPDPDEPVFHLYAEGDTAEDSARLEAKYREQIETFVAAERGELQTLN